MSLIPISLAACRQNMTKELRTDDTNALVIEKDDTLLQVNEHNTIKLAENVQGLLFDDTNRVIFYKQNGTVHASNSSLPSNVSRTLQCSSQQFNVTLDVTVPILVVFIHAIMYIVLITFLILKRYLPYFNGKTSDRTKSPQQCSPVYRSLTTVNGCNE